VRVFVGSHKYQLGHANVVEAMKMPVEAVRLLIKALRVPIEIVGNPKEAVRAYNSLTASTTLSQP
jgi:hypothetical protein